MWNKIKQFYWEITYLIRFIKITPSFLKEMDSEEEEYELDVTQLPIEELKKIQEKSFERVNKNAV